MRHALLVAMLLWGSGPTYAGNLVCENPGGAYSVAVSEDAKFAVFDADTRAIVLPIIASIDAKEARAYVIKTPDPAVTEVLHFWPEPKMEVFSDGELFQTDPCTD